MLYEAEISTEIIFYSLWYSCCTDVYLYDVIEIGWRAKLAPEDCPVSEYIFDVCISADGKRNTLQGNV